LKAVGAVTLALFVIYLVGSLEYWSFSVSALISWTIAEEAYDRFNIQKPNLYATETREFVVYSCIIIGLTALGALIVSLLIPNALSSQQSSNGQSVDWLSVLFYSMIAGLIAYAIPNFDTIVESLREWYVRELSWRL